MEDRDLRNYEMVLRVGDFGTEEAAFFPPTSLGGQLFANVKAGAVEWGHQLAKQVSGSTSARQGTSGKFAAREAVLDALQRIRRTARAMSATVPGIDVKFRIPRNATDQLLLAIAEAFVTDATPLRNDFIRFAMPGNFLEDLSDHIAAFRNALTEQQTGKGKSVMANAAMDDVRASVMADIRQLEAIVPNTFHDDPARLAAWMTARHVERSPRTKKTPSEPASGEPKDETPKKP
jgi:uncharacterized protein (DUF2342 family)